MKEEPRSVDEIFQEMYTQRRKFGVGATGDSRRLLSDGVWNYHRAKAEWEEASLRGSAIEEDIAWNRVMELWSRRQPLPRFIDQIPVVHSWADWDEL